VEPSENLDQRRLAGPVLAKKPVHFSSTHIQVDGPQRLLPAEILREVTKLERRRCAASLGTSYFSFQSFS
jgi:hypothetical protein